MFKFILTISFTLFLDLAFAEESKIGVVLPLTGGASSNGESIYNSIILAEKFFDRNDRVKFIFEDDQLLPKKTVEAVNKLINVDSVNGLIVFGSPTSLAVNGIAENAKVPMIGLSVVERVVKDKRYVVKHWVTAENESRLVDEEVIKRKYKTIAIVSTANDAMFRLRDLFLENNHAAVVLNEEFLPSDLDFLSTATKIKSLNPDAVYVLLWAPQPGLFSKKLRQIGYKGDIFGAHNIEDPNEVLVSNGALNGAWYVTGNDSKAGEFYQRYKQSYGKLPANGGINAYDSAKLMIDGIYSGNLNEYLHNVKQFEGGYGKYDATGKNDFDIPAKIKILSKDFLPTTDAR